LERNRKNLERVRYFLKEWEGIRRNGNELEELENMDFPRKEDVVRGEMPSRHCAWK